MPHRLEHELAGGVDLGGDGGVLLGVERPRLERVDLRHDVEHALELLAPAPEAIRPVQQDALGFLPFLLGQADQLVVELHRLERLHEPRGPG